MRAKLIVKMLMPKVPVACWNSVKTIAMIWIVFLIVLQVSAMNCETTVPTIRTKDPHQSDPKDSVRLSDPYCPRCAC